MLSQMNNIRNTNKFVYLVFFIINFSTNAQTSSFSILFSEKDEYILSKNEIIKLDLWFNKINLIIKLDKIVVELITCTL